MAKGCHDVFTGWSWGLLVNDSLLVNTAVHVYHSAMAAKFFIYLFIINQKIQGSKKLFIINVSVLFVAVILTDYGHIFHFIVQILQL